MLTSCFFIYLFLSHRPILNHNDIYLWLFSCKLVLFYPFQTVYIEVIKAAMLCIFYKFLVKIGSHET